MAKSRCTVLARTLAIHWQLIGATIVYGQFERKVVDRRPLIYRRRRQSLVTLQCARDPASRRCEQKLPASAPTRKRQSDRERRRDATVSVPSERPPTSVAANAVGRFRGRRSQHVGGPGQPPYISLSLSLSRHARPRDVNSPTRQSEISGEFNEPERTFDNATATALQI